MTLRRSAACLVAALVALPAAPAAAAGSPAADASGHVGAAAVPGPVAAGGAPTEVVALVEDATGRLSVRRTATSSRERAHVLAAALRREPGVVAADVPVPVRAATVSADPLQHHQWHLGAVRAPEAWELGDASGQVVAVLDTGVDLAHPDLVGALVSGTDLVSGDADPQDGHGHGTHVAGTVAAVGGNGVGLAGAALRSRVMPVKVLDDAGSGSSATVTQGVLWAVDHGADVINLSLGGPERDSALERAIAYAVDRGVVVVAAAGNEGAAGDPVNYPAASPGVLAVGAVDANRVRPSFSSTGSHLALAAPGVRIAATLPAAQYGTMSGTSMAAPTVASAAALLRAAAERAGVALSVAQVRSLLTSTAVDLGAAGHDAQHGYGLVDVLAARQALSTLLQPAPATAPAPAPAPEPAPSSEPAAEPEQTTTAPVLRDLSLACPLGVVPTTLLTDLTGNAHRRGVECLVWWDVARGTSTTTYNPSAPVTRAQMARFIASLLTRSGGSLPEPDLARFTDDDGSTHATAIGQLAAAGIVQGTSETTYGPDLPVTRAQMATFLARAAEARRGAPLPVAATSFSDVPAGAAHADSIGKAVGAGFTAGTTATAYGPARLVTRDQMGSFVARVLDLLVAEDVADLPLL